MEHLKYMQKGPEENDLKSCFAKLVNNNELRFKMPFLKDIIRNVLLEKPMEDSMLLNVLAESLIYYMSKFPGWNETNKYKNGLVDFNVWYNKFVAYLKFKVNQVIVKQDELLKQITPTSSNEITQVGSAAACLGTPGKTVLEETNYALQLSGPLKTLNSISYSNDNEDLIVRVETSAEFNLPLQIKAQDKSMVLNYPYLSCFIELPQLLIVRENLHVLDQCISFSQKLLPPNVNYIQTVNRVLNSPLKVYSYDFMMKYFETLLHVYQSIPSINEECISELAVIIREVLRDIRNLNVCDKTVPVSMRIMYNIGGCSYYRCRKHINTNTNLLMVVKEVHTPQIEFGVMMFKDEHVYTKDGISFQYIETVKTAIESNNKMYLDRLRTLLNSAVTYKCNYCKTTVSNRYADFLKHLEKCHGGERPLFCFKCRLSFDIRTLIRNRWSHGDGSCSSFK